MSTDRRIGIMGLIVAFFGIAAFYLWPDKRWIGWLSLCVATALLILWIFAELRRYWMFEGKNQERLHLSLDSVPPDTYGDKCRLKIKNSSKTVAAENVTVLLLEIRPHPRDLTFRAYRTSFPYRLYTSTGRESCAINPGDEAYFEVVRSWKASGGGVRMKILEPPFDSQKGSFAIEPDENWHFYLKISSANAGASKATLSLGCFQDRVHVELLG
jgi:hypothetical protein